MDPLRVAVRAVFAYLFLMVGTRLSGKRTLAQATVVEFVLALVIGDMVDDLLWGEVAAATFVAAVGTLFLLDVVGDLLASRVPAVGRLLGEAPILFMRSGKPVPEVLRSERLSEDTVEALLRMFGLTRDRWSDVKTAWIDGAGRPAVVLVEEAEPLDGASLAPPGER